MKKRTSENKSVSRIKIFNKPNEGIMKSKFIKRLQVSKVFIMNSGLQIKSAVDKRTESVARSDEFLFGVKKNKNCLTPDKLPKLQKSRLSEFADGFERKLNEVKLKENWDLVRGCIELIEIVGKEDFLFNSFLMKIRKELLRVEKEFRGAKGGGIFGDATKIEELKNGEKDKDKDKGFRFDGQTIIKSSSSSLPKSEILKPHNFLIQSPDDRLHSEFKVLESNLNTQSNTETKPRLSSQSQLLNFQSLQREVEHLKENESKYQLLITALKNRGYPVDEVFLFDVKQSPLIDDGHLRIYKPDHLSLTSEDSEFED